LVELAISSSCLDVVQGYVLIGSIYLIWKTTDELQATHYKMPKLPLGQRCYAISSRFPHHLWKREIVCSSNRLFISFALSPCWECCWCGDCSQALIVRRNALLSSDNLLFVLTFIGLALVVFIIPSQITIYEASADPSSLDHDYLYWLPHSRHVVLQPLSVHCLSKSRVVIMEIREVQLNMTQPVRSHALRRLRRITNDGCLSKFRGVSPTPKVELWEPDSRRLIANSSGALARCLRSATAKQVFTIAMTDYFASLVLPQLLPILEQTAPNIDLRIVRVPTSMPRVC